MRNYKPNSRYFSLGGRNVGDMLLNRATGVENIEKCPVCNKEFYRTCPIRDWGYAAKQLGFNKAGKPCTKEEVLVCSYKCQRKIEKQNEEFLKALARRSELDE